MFTCPRRNNSIRLKDVWEPDIWKETKGVATYWPEGREALRPRTCSFCHGAHPQDVFKLFEAGWEDDDHTQSLRMRGFLCVPGTRAERVAEDKSWRPHTKRISVPMRQPFPMLFFYVDHFTHDQVDTLNVIVEDLHRRLPKPR